MKPGTAWAIAIVGGGLAVILLGKVGLIVLIPALIFALIRTFF